jgi:hypothetical protein
MSDWIQLDASKLNIKKKEQHNGVDVWIGLSPFDVPCAVRGRIDESQNKFVIELSYLDNSEETREQVVSPEVSVVTGLRSGCLFAIKLDLRSLIPKTARVESVRKALGDANVLQRMHLPAKPVELVRRVIEENAAALLQGVS